MDAECSLSINHDMQLKRFMPDRSLACIELYYLECVWLLDGSEHSFLSQMTGFSRFKETYSEFISFGEHFEVEK